MDNDKSQENAQPKMSRRKLISSFGVAGAAVVAGGILGGTAAYGSSVTGSVYGDNAAPNLFDGETVLGKKFEGVLDGQGKIAFSHGLGASLPANVLLINAFIKLPDGKARRVEVDYVDGTHISIACGVPNVSVRAALLYSNSNSDW